jgi:hypothetical protein
MFNATALAVAGTPSAASGTVTVPPAGIDAPDLVSNARTGVTG